LRRARASGLQNSSFSFWIILKLGLPGVPLGRASAKLFVSFYLLE